MDVWHIEAPEVGERIVSAATGLVIHESTVRELIAAYTTFGDTVDFVVGHVPRRRSGLRILTPEDQDAYLDTPAYLRLVKLIGNLSYDERIDLMALAWFGRAITKSSPWTYFLNHTYRIGVDDPHYEAGLGSYWQAGLDRLCGEVPDTT